MSRAYIAKAFGPGALDQDTSIAESDVTNQVTGRDRRSSQEPEDPFATEYGDEARIDACREWLRTEGIQIFAPNPWDMLADYSQHVMERVQRGECTPAEGRELISGAHDVVRAMHMVRAQ